MNQTSIMGSGLVIGKRYFPASCPYGIPSDKG